MSNKVSSESISSKQCKIINFLIRHHIPDIIETSYGKKLEFAIDQISFDSEQDIVRVKFNAFCFDPIVMSFCFFQLLKEAEEVAYV